MSSNSSFSASKITTSVASPAFLFPQLEDSPLAEHERVCTELSIRKVSSNRKLKSNLNYN